MNSLIAATYLLLAAVNPKFTGFTASPIKPSTAGPSAEALGNLKEKESLKSQSQGGSKSEEAEIVTRPVRVKPDVILNKKKLRQLRMGTPEVDSSEMMTVRVTVYWKNGEGTDYYTKKGISSTGRRLVNKKSAAVDPKVIPYGSKIILPQAGKELLAIDTGSAVKNRTAAKKLGRDVPVVDIFFDNKSEALNFAKNNPMFMKALIVDQ